MPNRAPIRVGDVVSYRNAAGKTTDAVILGKQGAAPSASHFTVTASDSGGSLAAATYSYKVTAIVDGVETPPVAAAKTGVVTTGNSGSVTIDFTAGLAAYPTATSWRVYGRVGGSELRIATINAPTATYLDNGSVTPSGAQPSDNGAVRFRNFGDKTVQTQIPKATTTKQTGAYFNR